MELSDNFLAKRCDLLRSLHTPGNPLVLPNAWDAASARAVVGAGFPVVATTSGGVAAALGYEDEERAPAKEMLAAGARIAQAVEVPVTVDAEAGYGLGPDDLVESLRDAGAAGCNLEDTDHLSGLLVETSRQAKRLADVRRVAEELHYPLVINARIDVFLRRPTKSRVDLLDSAVARARAYLSAGADCVYPIGHVSTVERHQASSDLSHDELRSFVQAVEAPVNVLASPLEPFPQRLSALGVARISYGSSLYRLSMEHLAGRLAILSEVLTKEGQR